MFYRLASLLEADSLLAKALGYTAQEALREASILLHQTETLFRSSRVVTFLEGLPGCLALKVLFLDQVLDQIMLNILPGGGRTQIRLKIGQSS